jgi:hypothetical protein
MSRAIKVESCEDCPLEDDCDIRVPYFLELPIPDSCPLPKWPSVIREWIEEQTGGWLAPFEVGQTAADPRRIEVLATPLIIEILKSIGVEVKEVRDEKP